MNEHQSWIDNNVYDLLDKSRWALTVKRNKDGKFLKCKARWVLKGFKDKQQLDQQTDSPTSTGPGVRMAWQLAPNKNFDIFM